jgi:tRNA nucleotidyltransferase/poly(A) polymerase
MTDTLRRALAAVRVEQLYLVGGAVRDWALGRPAKDLDLAVAGDAAAVGRSLASAVDGPFFVMHPASQTARVALPDGTWLDLVPLPNGLEAGLRRRDFTINAMAVPLADWMNVTAAPAIRPAFLVDPTGGWADLQQRLIRATGESALRDDPLRAMRALRLFATIPGAHVDDATMALLRDAIPLLPSTSHERRRDEWLQVMDIPDAGISVQRAANLGILDHVLPEWRATVGITQNPYHHLDVWGHTLGVLKAFDGLFDHRSDGVTIPEDLRAPADEYLAELVSPPHTRRALLRHAILLHDIGKPAARTEDDEGRVRFLAHEHTGETMARSWAVRYRLSGRERFFLSAIVGLHMRPGGLLAPEVSKRAVIHFFRDAGPAAPALLLLNVADRLAARGPWTTEEEVETQVEGSWNLLRTWVEMRNTVALPLPVSGRDIMEAFGLAPGPRIGRIVQELRDIHTETPFQDRDAALEAARGLEERSEAEPEEASGGVADLT